MRWLKRILLILALALIAAMLLAAIGYRQLHQIPDFYTIYRWAEAERSIVNQRAVDKLGVTYNLAERARADAAAAEASRRDGGPLPNRPPTEPVTVTLSEEELNAFLAHNADVGDFSSVYERYITDPGIYLKDGLIILAARSKDLGCLVSLHFSASLDERGQLNLRMRRLQGGSLPLPRELLSTQIDRVRRALRRRMIGWQATAKMAPDGTANRPVVNIAMSKLLLSMLADEPAPGVLFIPTSPKQSFPLRLSRLDVSNGAVTLTLAPMAADERAKLMEQIRTPIPAASAD